MIQRRAAKHREAFTIRAAARPEWSGGGGLRAVPAMDKRSTEDQLVWYAVSLRTFAPVERACTIRSRKQNHERRPSCSPRIATVLLVGAGPELLCVTGRVHVSPRSALLPLQNPIRA
jgi:hypothetical protein